MASLFDYTMKIFCRAAGHALVIAALVLAAPASASADNEKDAATVIMALGTSLTAGYGLLPENGFTSKLQNELSKAGHNVEIRNAGVSGDTSAGGLARLEWSLDTDVDAAIVELGSNDALRGLSPEQTEKNLDQILSTLQKRNIPVLLAGMLSPPNLGPEYAADFEGLYPRLAEKHGVSFYPFFLDGVAAEPQLNQPDGIHPNADGVAIIVERLSPFVIELVNRVTGKANTEDALH